MYEFSQDDNYSDKNIRIRKVILPERGHTCDLNNLKSQDSILELVVGVE